MPLCTYKKNKYISIISTLEWNFWRIGISIIADFMINLCNLKIFIRYDILLVLIKMEK